MQARPGDPYQVSAAQRAPDHVAGTARQPVGDSKPWTILFFLVVLAAVSRGALEVAIGKTPAYVVQTAAVAFFVLALFLLGGPRLRGRGRWALGGAYLFVLAALISMAVTLETRGVDYSGPFVLAMVFYVLVIAVFAAFDFEAASRIAVGPVLGLIGILLVGFALAQQFAGFIALPGIDLGTFDTYVRPSSLTGSFLHYPIAVSILAFALLGIAAQRRRVTYAILGVGLLLAVGLSLSRSGIVIMLIGLVVGVLLIPGLAARIRAFIVLGLAAILALIFLPTGLFIDRVLSIGDPNGPGNSLRIDRWTEVVSLWLQSPLVVGDHTGLYTNVTSNLAGADVAVAESGFLQTLISFGLLGVFALYGTMLASVRALPRVPPWFVAGAVGALIQTLVYQSIEVFPFMILFAIGPLVASRYADAGPGASPMGPARRG